MLQKTPKNDEPSRSLVISAPNMKIAQFHIRGVSPYQQSRFTEKAINAMRAKQEAGGQGNTKRIREAKDFDAAYEGAKHVSSEGWCGIPAGAFRTGMIDCCRLVGYKMTFAKLSIFVEPDGFDRVDGDPLVKIIGEPEMTIKGMRNDNGGMDLRARPMWRDWEVILHVRFDEDQFALEDVSNLLSRVGQQCGVGEGRPNSRESPGCGFGLFEILGDAPTIRTNKIPPKKKR